MHNSTTLSRHHQSAPLRCLFSSPPMSAAERRNRGHNPSRNFISQSFQSLTRFFLTTPFAPVLSWRRKGIPAFSQTGYFSHDKSHPQTAIAALELRPSIRAERIGLSHTEKSDYFPRSGTIIYRRARIAFFGASESRQKPLLFPKPIRLYFVHG